MSWLEALFIGLIQGLTEFLPVSSSGHIELSKVLFDTKEEDILLTIILHAATALSTVVVFRKDIGFIFKGLLKFQWNDHSKFTFYIVLSMIPAAVAGLFFEEQLNMLFNGNLLLVSVALLATGLILFISDRVKIADPSGANPGKTVGPGSAFAIGLVQALAILPGISRSGSTIGTAVLLGINRERAARFSFLMVLPLILGAAAKKGLDLYGSEAVSTSLRSDWGVYAVGFVAAFISGIFACKWMIALVKRSRLTWFAIYCWIVGGIGLSFLFFS